MMWVSYVTGNALLNTGVTVAVRHYQAQPVPDNGVQQRLRRTAPVVTCN